MSTWQVTGDAAAGRTTTRAPARETARVDGRNRVGARGVAMLATAIGVLLLTLALPAPAWVTTAGLVTGTVVAGVGWETAITASARSRVEEPRHSPER